MLLGNMSQKYKTQNDTTASSSASSHFVSCYTITLFILYQIIPSYNLFFLSAAQIQRALVRNNQTQRFSQRQALRLHQGLVTSTAEQVALGFFCAVLTSVCV